MQDIDFFLLDEARAARDISKVEHHRLFKLIDDKSLDTQGIDDDFFILIEFHKVESAKSRGVLILRAAHYAHFLALYLIGELSYVVFS